MKGSTLLVAIAGWAVVVGGVQAQEPSDAIAARGEYLTRAADCSACHTLPGRAAFSGGNAFKTPFGTIYAPNITPDRATGIGAWTDVEFLRALRQGVGRQGEQLYPAFPYAQFTGLSDKDALAIKAYLFSLPAVRRTVPANVMEFPYGFRPLMRGWKLLNFHERRLPPDPTKSAGYNRGRYLAEALGHCNECHSPRTLTMGLDASRHLGGGVVEGWQAYNITPDPVSGIGGWSAADIANYLATGRLGDRAQTAGPMATVVSHSTRFLTPADRNAIAIYLLQQPLMRSPDDTRSRAAFGHADPDRLGLSAPRAKGAEPDGRAIYAAACASCHGLDGRGLPGPNGYPALVGNGAVGARSRANLVLTVLEGVQRQGPKGLIYMPAFGPSSPLGNALNDAEIGRLTSYIVRQFGNPAAGPVTPDDVARLRAGEAERSLLVTLVDAAMVIAVILVLVGAWLLMRRRRA